MGHRLPAGGAAVSTTRRRKTDASDVDTGARLSRRWVSHKTGREKRSGGSKVKAVERGEIIDYVTYDEQRDSLRAQVMEAKSVRRIHIGDYLTLLFENHLTMKYQIQEMVRVERMVKESDIQH